MDRSSIKDLLLKYNFWPQVGQKLDIPIGFLRRSYLQVFKSYLGSNLIKVLNGQRRSGKSYLMRQLIHYLIEGENTPVQNILYINFENERFDFVKNNKDLRDLVDFFVEEFADTKQKIYLFFDEIQEVEAWEKTINSFKEDYKIDCEIFITGSNSKLLSSELATYLTGRYIELKIYPISFEEYLDIKDVPRSQDSLIEFLSHSQLPELLLEENLELKKSYLRTIRSSILLNDIVKRFAIKNVDLLEKLFMFLVDNIANLFSTNSLVKALEQQGYDTNPVTLGNYLKYLEYSLLIYGVDRFNLKGQRTLEGERKFYLNDLGFRNYLSSSFDAGMSKKLENFVFQTLMQKGFDVHVGILDDDREVDFVAEKDGQKIYLQVTYLLESEKVVEREYGNLERIKDNWPKYVVSMDKIDIPSRNGIQHLRAWELNSVFDT